MACLAACLMVWFVGGWLFGIMCAWFVVPCCSAGWLNVCLGNVIDWPVRDMVGWLMGWFLGVLFLGSLAVGGCYVARVFVAGGLVGGLAACLVG